MNHSLQRYETPQDVYARHLSSRRGYPLWMPEVKAELPKDYQDHGIKIGDVGYVVPEQGCFEVLFNITLPQDHDLHRDRPLPRNFQPIILNEALDIATYPGAEVAGSVIKSTSVTTVEIGPEGQPSDYKFTFSSSEGALLILPHGADQRSLHRYQSFGSYAMRHAVEWYRFVEEDLGRIISNNSLYLITGFYKSCSWALAAFEEAEDPANIAAQFKITQQEGRSLVRGYRWTTTRHSESRVGPELYSGKTNQAVYIRGFKVAVRPEPLGRRQIMVRVDHPSVETRWEEFSETIDMQEPDEAQGDASGNSAHASDGNSKGKGTLRTIKHVSVQSVPQVSDPFHPSDTINKYLLQKAPSATVAITHDSQWAALLKSAQGELEAWELADEHSVVEVLSKRYGVALKDGAVFLQSAVDTNDTLDVEGQVKEVAFTEQKGDQIDALHGTLKELVNQFCPPLDISLLQALIADLDSLPQPDQVDALRRTLKELANQATDQYVHERADKLDSTDISSLCRTTNDSSSSSDLYSGTTEPSATSVSSAISYQPFSSPIGFLQAALPHIPLFRLQRALNEAGASNEGDVDMESVVEAILAGEFIRELEERGLDALDNDILSEDDGLPWKRVKVKKPNGKASEKKNIRGKTITLVDIRQQHHQQPPASSRALAPDPWTQLSSLSEYLSTLLPPHTPSFFQSYFHSPAYASHSKALRAALSSIAGNQIDSSSEMITTLFTVLDILRDSPAYTSLDTEQRSTLYSDAQLALRATRGRRDDAINVVWFLLELDLDLDSGSLAMGVYHTSQPPLLPSSPSAWSSSSAPSSPPRLLAGRDRSGSTSKAARQLPSGPPPVLPPPTSKRKSISSASSTATSPTTTGPNPFQWQTVPEKPAKGPHPLALHIPAYDSTNQSRRSAGMGKRGAGNGLGKGGKGDVGELSRPDVKQRMAASLRKRNELLREASKAWSRGNAKTRGGEVALYFAERARECQESVRREALNEARLMVESKRSASADRRTVDLHGTSIAEAVVIVKDILDDEGCSAANPLRIITGRGTHSANGVGVLKPAVRNALTQDGWNVGVWDGGLVVRGRT